MDVNLVLSILLGVNLLVLVLNVVFWLWVSKTDWLLRVKKQRVDRKYNEILEKANKEAHKILREAMAKASAMINEARLMVSDIQEEARRNFDQARVNYLQQLNDYLQVLEGENKAFLKQLKNDVVDGSRGLIDTMLGQLREETKQFTEQVKAETSAVGADIRSRLNSLWEDVLREVETYKKERLAEVDRLLQNSVRRVITSVLRDSLSAEDHKKLIIRALERAKKQGLFNKISGGKLID